MRNEETILNRAKRLDRVMTWVITLGGMVIIAAVLGILVFIGKEAYPLFRPARSREVAVSTVAPGTSLVAEDTGKALATLDPEHGVRGYAAGRPVAHPDGGPTLPWLSHTPLDAKGQFAALGHDGKLAFGQVTWDKGGDEAQPAGWTLLPTWTGAIPSAEVHLLNVKPLPLSGIASGSSWRLVALDGGGQLVWSETDEGATTQLDWKALSLPAQETPVCAQWNGDSSILYVGTHQGGLHAFTFEDGPKVAASAAFGEPVTALGFALGGTSLLAGGERGTLAAFQLLKREDGAILQNFHHFATMGGPVLGFMASQRDKRFMVWSKGRVAVDHLTTERRLFEASVTDLRMGALSTRGDQIFAADGAGCLHSWNLDAPHPEISAGVLWGKVHYESYPKPEYVWQSSGGTDDFEPKLSLMPLVFGTVKGTFYAMIFALPLAVLGALYTSQFASPRLRGTIKPIIEIMAALPSVVLGFLAGLVLAPLFERSAVNVLILPGVTLLLALLLFPLWRKLPKRVRLGWGTGWEVVWLLPMLLAALALSTYLGPVFERLVLGGDFRGWLLQTHGLTYDQRNSLVVGFAMGFAVIPIIFTISEDALSAVPKSLSSASLACGASPWQTAWRVVLPTASPGIFSAVMVGLGRAIGETMIVLMATGNTPVMDWSPFNGMRTLAANIAVETPEAPVHGSLYRLLFFTAALLFVLTFLLNTAAELVRQHLRKRYESF